MPVEEAGELILKMEEEQPGMVNYLLQSSGELNYAEQEILLYLGMVIWLVMAKGEKEFPQITQEELEQSLEDNFKAIRNIPLEKEKIEDWTIKMLETYPQPAVLAFVLDTLVGEERIREENKGQIFVHLKALIDRFDKE